jgi:hypothetical protein
MNGIVGCYKQELSTICDRIKLLAFESSYNLVARPDRGDNPVAYGPINAFKIYSC